MDAVVMAAGEGRRLRPLTELWPKPVLPIDGRPVIATLLAELTGAEIIEQAWIVAGHLAEYVERIAEEAYLRPQLQFVRQPEALGSADAVARALDAGAKPPLLVSAADTVYAPGDVGRFAAVGQAAVAWRRRPRGTALQIEDGLVVRVPSEHETGHFAAPLWLLTDEVARHLDGLPGPPFELASAFQRAIDAGTTVKGVEIGPTRDLTTPPDLVRQNFPYLANESDE